MKFFWITFIWSMPLLAQDNFDVKYLVRFNDDLNGGRRERLHDGYIKVRGNRSVSYFVSRESYKPKSELDKMKSIDTIFYTYTDLKVRSLVFQDFDLMGNRFWVSDSLHPMPWQIHSEQRKIGNLTCTKATTVFRGRNYTAWFTSDIPIPLGPWKMGGLPGLIVELEEDDQNLIVKLQSLQRNPESDDLNIPEAKMNWDNSVSKKRKLIERIKGLSRANGSTDCISCQSDSKVTIVSWEKF